MHRCTAPPPATFNPMPAAPSTPASPGGLQALLMAGCTALAGPAAAAFISYAGALDDPGNTALVGSDLGAADFGSAQGVANNVALLELDLATGGTVQFRGRGLAEGGLMPYFSLFEGRGPQATFIDSSDARSGSDFGFGLVLLPGTYTMALGSAQNMSFAENRGRGTLGDGFIGQGDPQQLGNGRYHFNVITAVSEPPTLTLIAAALWAMSLRQRHRR